MIIPVGKADMLLFIAGNTVSIERTGESGTAFPGSENLARLMKKYD